QFYKDLLYGIEIIHRPKEVAHINHDLPIYLIAGTNDPVGNHGKGVKQVYEQYLAEGIHNVSLSLYQDARHELLSELNKQEVYTDVSNWLENILSSKSISRSEEHTSELQSRFDLVCRLLLEKKNTPASPATEHSPSAP